MSERPEPVPPPFPEDTPHQHQETQNQQWYSESSSNEQYRDIRMFPLGSTVLPPKVQGDIKGEIEVTVPSIVPAGKESVSPRSATSPIHSLTSAYARVLWWGDDPSSENRPKADATPVFERFVKQVQSEVVTPEMRNELWDREWMFVNVHHSSQDTATAAETETVKENAYFSSRSDVLDRTPSNTLLFPVVVSASPLSRYLRDMVSRSAAQPC